jgi:hypothetical protein
MIAADVSNISFQAKRLEQKIVEQKASESHQTQGHPGNEGWNPNAWKTQ